ncbi:YbfB/YjiJ family MFS transporter [Variovorax saccharolyticus]|uniref:YbfB/YjiJ family MFS transporter n=1 Tax=Variovorax saccharolyticus TaxID=3053516 RepID=UPI0025790751|nr:YbfB/YjiJ family MFS transporter [Variovorax sp. J31P216]MDM0028850.1 YbfB/YjiJ family MFS transporter [Variovorax sp. J31P216]
MTKYRAGSLDHRGSASPDLVLPWRATLAGFCASLVGLGLARFAYTPLLPAIVGARWFSAGDAAYLGAANLAGYLLGAVIASPLASHLRPRTVLRCAMLLASLAILACAWPVSFSWFFAWRLLSGAAGGTLMVLAAPTVLTHIPANRRGLASGVIFTGIGLGIAASGTLVPLLLHQGLRETWLGLGVLALSLTALAWMGWPAQAPNTAKVNDVVPRLAATHRLKGLYAQYALNAAGLVPHMIFLVDFVVRGLDRGLAAGAQYWVVFGLGAMVGPILSGHLADRIGFGTALRVAYVMQAAAVVIPAFATDAVWLIVSSFVVGAFTPGIVPLVLGRVAELLQHHAVAQRAAWGGATTGFATLQAIAAYALAFLLDRSGGDYALLFYLGAAAIALALVIDLASDAWRTQQDAQK